MMVEAQRTALAAPAGSLVVLDATWRTRQAFVWGWAIPFTMQPPFAPEDLTRRVGVVGHYWAYCCPQEQWRADLRRQFAAWSDAQPAYFVAMRGSDPAVLTGSDAGAPRTRAALRAVPLAATPEEAERRLQAALREAFP